MNLFIYINALLLLISCHQNRKISRSSKQSKEYQCINSIAVGSIPELAFQNHRQTTSLAYLTDSVFVDYRVSKGYENATKMYVLEHDYIEFTKHFNPDVNLPRNKGSTNKFTFYREQNKYVLGLAELTFNETSRNDLLKVVKDTTVIHIGIVKKEVGNIFGISGRLCDTVNIHNDSDESWYLFRNGKLDKIIIESYIH